MMNHIWLMALVALAGCVPSFAPREFVGDLNDDYDGDSYTEVQGDCDDDADDVYPGADEVCDGADNDCDEETDEDSAVDAPIWYVDADEDGHGNANISVTSCTQPTGYVSQSDDCDDGDNAIHPEVLESCDGVDNDCDEQIDEDDAYDASTWFTDVDVDGYGNADTSIEACSQPPGYVDNSDDCDDSNSGLNPDTPWYADGDGDGDGDGYGDSNLVVHQCFQPAGFEFNPDDCDDDDPLEHPGITWYADSDWDGYGDSDTPSECKRAVDTDVIDHSDCDDSDPTEHPGVIWYADVDGDTYGDSASVNTCERANLTDVLDNTDCDDGDWTENPAVIWYADSDGDTYGDPASSNACQRVESTDVTDDTDCDDTDSSEHPDVVWYADSDGNTYGDIEENPDAIWYADTDGDFFGDPGVLNACKRAQPTDVLDNSDCDDGDGLVNPAATEVCDALNIDEDCENGAEDDDPFVTGKTPHYFDSDLDGHGDEDDDEPLYFCDPPADYSPTDDDCNDGNANINPSVAEICDVSDNDEDCDDTSDDEDPSTVGKPLYYADTDSDGFGDDVDPVAYCDPPAGYSLTNDDCDDGDAEVYPGVSWCILEVGDILQVSVGEGYGCAMNVRGELSCWGGGGNDIDSLEPPQGVVARQFDARWGVMMGDSVGNCGGWKHRSYPPSTTAAPCGRMGPSNAGDGSRRGRPPPLKAPSPRSASVKS
jgi:large repetitive protein